MDKSDIKEITKSIINLSVVIKEQCRQIEKLNQAIKENSDAIKELRSRIGNVLNNVE